ncbi:outer dynein arm-docking complex subunit 4-like [Lycorma delicatula]|uniref:outer dynein arm-docking complex subunit 4-like n=1 Tax=Lycorma delicatula TaxID=130591 RepID=UPI003F50FB0C
MAMEAETETGVDTLVARSKAYSHLSKHDKARADAELALKRAPEKPSVLENDAYTLYNMDHFEDALVGYYRGLRIRQKPDYFLNGVLVATETVEECVGRHTGDLLSKENLGDTILRLWLYEQNLLEPWITPEQLHPVLSQRCKDQLEKYFGEKYLNRLGHDKQFLLSCVGNTQLLYSGDPESYMELQNVIIDAVVNINRKQELAAAKLAFQLVNAARDAQMKHDTVLCLRMADRAKEYIWNQPKRLIKNKSVYIANLFSIIGDLYFGMKEFVPSWTKDENDLRILYMIGVNVVNKCEEEHIRGTFLPYIYDPRKLLEESEKQLALATTALERAYLFHDMSRCLGQLKKYELARTMGRRCAQEARPVKAFIWAFNGMFMVARFESLQRNFVDAKNTIIEATEIIRKLNKTNCLDFLMRTHQLLEFASSMEDGSSFQLKREQDILNCMPDRDMKMAMQLIFLHMSRVPPENRLMLIPGVRATSTRKKKTMKKKPSIQPITIGTVKERRHNQAHALDSNRHLEMKLLSNRPSATRLSTSSNIPSSSKIHRPGNTPIRK